MKESYSEGIANHTGPESCVGGREADGEALTGVRTGWVLNRERYFTSGCRRIFSHAEGNTLGIAIAKMLKDPARSQTPRTCGNSMHRSWEIPCLARADGVLVRAVNHKERRR